MKKLNNWIFLRLFTAPVWSNLFWINIFGLAQNFNRNFVIYIQTFSWNEYPFYSLTLGIDLFKDNPKPMLWYMKCVRENKINNKVSHDEPNDMLMFQFFKISHKRFLYYYCTKLININKNTILSFINYYSSGKFYEKRK